ncbi:MAG: hypothetical protein AAF569_05700 [Pseudomonadota bacterium]
MHTTFQPLGSSDQTGFESTRPQKQNFARKTPVDPYTRTAGSIPTLDLNRLSEKQNTLARLTQASNPNYNFETALSYASDNANNINAPNPEDSGYSFGDIIDAINPMHHIPLVSTLYRGITGDDIKPASQIIGGTLYGGPVGAVSSTVNVVIEHETGRDITGNALAILAGDVIKSPEIKIDRTRDILNFSDQINQPFPTQPKKTNFWNAVRTYERMSGYNS